VRNGTDVNASATEATKNARDIDTLKWDSSKNYPQAVFVRGAPFDQQSVTDWARPASLVSLYLLFMSLAVWARA